MSIRIFWDNGSNEGRVSFTSTAAAAVWADGFLRHFPFATLIPEN